MNNLKINILYEKLLLKDILIQYIFIPIKFSFIYIIIPKKKIFFF